MSMIWNTGARCYPAAAPAAPPSGENAERILTALNGYTVPFSYNTPADPISSSSATVTTATLAANIVAGRTVTLQAGAYGGVTVAVDDFDMICEAGVSFTGLTITGDRFRITGGGSTTLDGLLYLNGANVDVMIDNIFIVSDADFESIALDGGLHRICFKNVTLTASHYNNWGLIGGDADPSDLFILRCDMSYTNTNGSRTATRITGWNKIVYVNNRMASTMAGVRFNNTSDQPSTYTCIAQNQFENTNMVSAVTIEPDNGGGAGAGLVMDNGWMEDNNIYVPSATQSIDVGFANPTNIQNWSFTGNRAYCSATNDSEITNFNYGTGCSRSDNLNKTYVSTPGVPANVGAT